MTHKFDVKNRHKLDNEKRREMLPPEKTLISLGLHEGDIMADIGCGIGYFTIPAARIVGENGKVIAMDILPLMISDVEIKIKENNLNNVTAVLTEENNLKIQDESVTFAFISNVLHEAENKEKFIRVTKRILSSNGRIAIVEWNKIAGEYGPPIDHRLGMEELKELLTDAGFNNIKHIDISEHFYAVVGAR